MSVFRQMFFIPSPVLTEKNCPDQTGRVYLITGGYGGLGLELAHILYQHHATLYLAGRSVEKATKAIADLHQAYPAARGAVHSINVDFADLASIKPAAEQFLNKQVPLHGLVLNAGVMWPPAGSKSPQGEDLQLATNVLGSYLLYKLLRPRLVEAARTASPGAVRVTWASSITMATNSPRPGGLKMANGAPDQHLSVEDQYAQSKAANTHLAALLAPQDSDANIMHLSFNPGNLASDLTRHMSTVMQLWLRWAILYPPRMGAYTELWALLADVPMHKSGAFVAPWGRLEVLREDIQAAIDDHRDGSVAQLLYRWVEDKVKPYT